MKQKQKSNLPFLLVTQKIGITCLLIIIGIIIFLLSPLSPYRPKEALGFEPEAQGLKRVADFYFDVATGDVQGHSSINKFGQNPDVDSAAAEDIWDVSGVWNEPSTGQVYTFTSTSTDDDVGGTGALTIEIFGLDSPGALQNETFAMAGTGVVTAASLYSMIHRMVVRTAGSGGANAGAITANANTDGNITAQISAGNNQTLMAVFKIPAGFDGCIINYYATLNKATGQTATVNIALKAKPAGEVYQVKQVLGIVKDGASGFNRISILPDCFEPLTIIKMSADTNVDSVDISAGFDLVLHPN